MNVSLTSSTTQATGLYTPQLEIKDKDTAKLGDETLKVSYTVGKEGVGGGSYKIELELPIKGGEVSLTELEQACKDLGMSPLEMMAVMDGAKKAINTAGSIATMIAEMGVEGTKANLEAVVALLDNTASTLAAMEKKLFDVIEGGAYPDYTSFLKLMLKSAQELREFASEAKMACLNGQYDVMMDQVANMKSAADKNFEAAKKEIEAAKTEAIFGIIGGCLSMIGAMAGARGNQAALQAGTALSTIMSASGTIHVSGEKLQAAELKKDAEYLEAANKALDALLKQMDANVSIADELKEIAKTLQDMVLNLYKDFISAHTQVMQHANI
ncbi:MAG: hypothetical protein ACAI34_03210 [Verrucomicrobium sp.]|nr:hypothetical protein [Verrucomicrobium sp.]